MSNKTPQEQTREIIDRLAGKGAPVNRKPDPVISKLLGLTPMKEPPPDDMPALEQIKLYARSGYHMHHIGTDEDFERVWGETFPEEEKGRKI